MTHCIDCGAAVIPPLRYLCPTCAAREGIQAYEPPPLPTDMAGVARECDFVLDRSA